MFPRSHFWVCNINICAKTKQKFFPEAIFCSALLLLFLFNGLLVMGALQPLSFRKWRLPASPSFSKPALASESNVTLAPLLKNFCLVLAKIILHRSISLNWVLASLCIIIQSPGWHARRATCCSWTRHPSELSFAADEDYWLETEKMWNK